MVKSLINCDGNVYSVTVKSDEELTISGNVYNGDGSVEVISTVIPANEEYTFTMKYRALIPYFDAKKYELMYPSITISAD